MRPRQEFFRRHTEAGLTEIEWVAADPLLKAAGRVGAAVIVAAGPWLVSVVALALISVTMTPVLGYAAVEDLRLTVVYAFCIAPLAAGPVGAIAARQISAQIEMGETAPVAELFLSAALLSGMTAQVLALVVSLTLGIGPASILVGFVSLTVAAALLWTCFSVLAAMNSYTFLIAAFTGGMILSVACMTVVDIPTTEVLIWSFSAGISLCVALSMRHIQRRFACDYQTIVPTFRELLALLRRHAVLCAGVLFAICGIWVDKWVFWFSPSAARSTAGFLHSSGYDSVMFLAHLSAIPTYAGLLLFHRSDLVAAIEGFRKSLEDRATYGLLRRRIDQLERVSWSGIVTIACVQAGVTIGFVMMSPVIVDKFDFNFDQLLILRVGLIAVFFHSILFLFCTLLLVANRIRHFSLVQGGFLVSNLLLSVILQSMIGMSAYAMLASAILSAVICFRFAFMSIRAYDYQVFVTENEALYVPRYYVVAWLLMRWNVIKRSSLQT